jgi:quercetin dioxygenase-like cupin family protein
MTGSLRALVVAPGDGDRLAVGGTERLTKMTGRDSSGHLTVHESTYATDSPSPLHIHHDAIESFYLLEGTCRFRVGDDVVDAEAGAFLSVPRGAAHGLVAIGGPARALVMFTPAAMEGYWEEMAAATEAGPPDPDRLQEMARRYHLEIVGPWPDG